MLYHPKLLILIRIDAGQLYFSTEFCSKFYIRCGRKMIATLQLCWLRFDDVAAMEIVSAFAMLLVFCVSARA